MDVMKDKNKKPPPLNPDGKWEKNVRPGGSGWQWVSNAEEDDTTTDWAMTEDARLGFAPRGWIGWRYVDKKKR
jgi:hypothetical protein